MTHNFNVSGEDRKNLVKAISEHLGVPSKYLGVPTCAYQIGSYTVSKEGELSGEDSEESSTLLQALEEAGFHSDEQDRLTISMPREKFSEAAIENLKALVASKGELMKRAFKTESLEIELTDEQVSFPWFPLEGPDTVDAYTRFIQAITEMVTTQVRVSAKPKEIINEKYEFRCFLLRLGMIGNDYKQTRKILLRNLSGSAAFKSGAKKGGEQA